MQKTIASAAALTPVLVLAGELAQPASAAIMPQNLRVQELYTDLQGAICQNDWEQALKVIQPMIASANITPDYREQLVHLRAQLQGLHAGRSQLAGLSNCANFAFSDGRTIEFSSNAPIQDSAQGVSIPVERPFVQGQRSRQSTVQSVGVQQLYVALQEAVCRSDWDQAVAVINPMIGSAEISPDYREQLVYFRARLNDLRSSRASFATPATCGAIATQPTSELSQAM